MLGFLLISISTFFVEIGSSIGKFEVRARKESIYTMVFLSLFWSALFIFLIGVWRNHFIFSLASLPTFLLKIFLEIIQLHVTALAITRADRSTFGFLRIITIPLLLTADILLGYAIGPIQLVGVGIIILSFIVLFINHGVKKEGAWFVIFSAVNAVATISLYKYHITYFNSVEAEQSIILAVLMVYFFVMAHWIAKENPIRFLKKPVFLLQSSAAGVGTLLFSFAYLFAPASIITTAKRAFSILWSIVSGNLYFHEKHVVIKLVSFFLMIIGLVMLVI